MANYQSDLLQALWHQGESSFGSEVLSIYRNNLLMNANRALAITYPTVVPLLGEDVFNSLIKDFIQYEMLEEGDWGVWGKTFPDWLEQQASLGDYAFIADCARLDRVCHHAERASDIENVMGFEIASETELASVKLQYCAGVTLLESSYPVVDIWLAHHSRDENQRQSFLQQAKNKLTDGAGQHALVWRPHWKANVRELDETELDWIKLTLSGHGISDALDQVNPQFDFETWLQQSTSEGLVTGFYQEKYDDLS
ncbi:putative DNA-binding domain-containing protein [Methylophaga sp.]|uniref:HvfC/BufC family peptide modification chaperone n=1 Tax=Methylophaga sp. TaxID=2024840 RepID=UPI003A91B43E